MAMTMTMSSREPTFSPWKDEESLGAQTPEENVAAPDLLDGAEALTHTFKVAYPADVVAFTAAAGLGIGAMSVLSYQRKGSETDCTNTPWDHLSPLESEVSMLESQCTDISSHSPVSVKSGSPSSAQAKCGDAIETRENSRLCTEDSSQSPVSLSSDNSSIFSPPHESVTVTEFLLPSVLVAATEFTGATTEFTGATTEFTGATTEFTSSTAVGHSSCAPFDMNMIEFPFFGQDSRCAVVAPTRAWDFPLTSKEMRQRLHLRTERERDELFREKVALKRLLDISCEMPVPTQEESLLDGFEQGEILHEERPSIAPRALARPDGTLPRRVVHGRESAPLKSGGICKDSLYRVAMDPMEDAQDAPIASSFSTSLFAWCAAPCSLSGFFCSDGKSGGIDARKPRVIASI